MFQKMSLLNKPKKQIIAEFAQDSKNTGSTEVQCAIATYQINSLTEHLKIHKKDFSSKRGLIILVGKRRSLLDYLKNQSQKRYEDLIKKLDIRK
jgi:small subunit ribosomal protein S15